MQRLRLLWNVATLREHVLNRDVVNLRWGIDMTGSKDALQNYKAPSLASFGTLASITALNTMGPYCDAVNMLALSTDNQNIPFCM